MRNQLLVFLFFICCATGFAQKGTVAGTITDKDVNNEPLPFSNVVIKGTTIAVTTDESGKYSISLDAGKYVIQFSFLGYEPQEENITVVAGETLTVNKTLGAGSYTLKDVTVQGTANHEKESTLLLEQKNAVEMKQAIGSQEISRKGINDAAGAVLKTAGVSKTEGVNNVFVRGLGDRYNSTTLNGLPLPSEDPVYKNISLSFFGSNIIKNISVNKTFNAGLYGDVAGANIDIASKELDKSSVLSITATSGVNTSAVSAGSDFLVADGAFNYLGTLTHGRNSPITSLQQYDFKSNFKPNSEKNPVNSGFNVIAGGKIKLGENQSLSLFGVANSSSSYTYNEGFAGAAYASGFLIRDLKMQRSQYDASQTYLGNAKYKFGAGSISANSIYLHDNSQYVGHYVGFDRDINDNVELPGSNKSIIVRQQANNNNLFSNQLLGDYKFSDKITANAGITYNTIRATEPDRKTNRYLFDDAHDVYKLSTGSAGDNNRYFSTLDENDLAAKAEVNYTFNPEKTSPTVVTIGGNYRSTDRTFDFLKFNYDFSTPPNVDPNNPDALFNQQHLDLGADAGGFNLLTDRGGASNSSALNPFYYKASRDIGAGYAKFTHTFRENLTAQLGVRLESVKQHITWDTNISSSVHDLLTHPSNLDKTYVLPSLNLKYTLNEKNALRFAVSESYTMPQFKEVAPFLYEEINSSEYGNPNLLASTDYNVDAKYDFSPSKKELISLGAFYKYIKDPISRIQVASAANDYSYVNTDKAFVAGAELEVKKTLYSVEGETRNKDFSLGLNASYLYSEQVQNDVTSDNLTVNFTHDKGRMQGAAPWLVNADLSYTTSNENTSLLSTLVFNYFYDKVYSVATDTQQNTIEKSVPTLDFVNKFQLKKYKLGLSVSALNLLNPKYKLTMDTTDPNTGALNETLINSFRKGMVFSVGLNWTL
jgi:TonB-dependent receptor